MTPRGQSERELLTKDDKVRPFANGGEYRWWTAQNCEGCRSYNPNATSSRHGCPMEVAFAMAYVSDGLVPVKTALRAGIVEPVERGLLALVVPNSGECPERRPKDEPDDRPRRGPRPPAGQLDIFDPRNVDGTTRTNLPVGSPIRTGDMASGPVSSSHGEPA